MAPEVMALLTDAGRELDRAGWPITPERKPSLRDQQPEYLQRRFLQPAPIARTEAALHFAEGPTTTIGRDIHDGRRLVGIIRERSGFVTVVGEEVLGPYSTVGEAIDALLELSSGRVP